MTTRTLSELAAISGAVLRGEGALGVKGPAALRDAGPDEISFLADLSHADLVRETRAGAVLVPLDFKSPREDLPLLLCEDPGRAFDAVVLAFVEPLPPPQPGVHPTAVVDPSAQLGAGVHVGPLAVVGPEAELGDGVVIHPHAVIGRGARLARGCEVHPGAVLYPGVRLGEGAIVHAGAVLGCDGFGYVPGEGGLEKVPQVGDVELGARVEIGANSTVDRARFGTTRVGEGTKIDNLAHVGHNVQVGAHSVLCAQVGLAGSVRLGTGVVLGGQVGIADHLALGDGCQVAGKSGVHGDVPAGQQMWGNPARPRRQAMRILAESRRLPDQVRALQERQRELLERIQQLEKLAEEQP